MKTKDAKFEIKKLNDSENNRNKNIQPWISRKSSAPSDQRKVVANFEPRK